ncbi:hypothetical protein [Caldicoprobacter faecalis]|uniref:Uncharacterized protein n=1 Tax=Caldicoprobacter faecalis TaxID=937334 RepID=A0A1I5WUJ2_9FIRM|nr:hypothetical protein [Caldicoprobacter faecalis]SFQ23278.1 hypothetical protein SAMN05444406_11936 [Caldicoprobacter faecalis]
MENAVNQLILAICLIAIPILIMVLIDSAQNKKHKPKDHFSKTLVHVGGHPYIPTDAVIDFDIIDNKVYLIHGANNYKEEILPQNIKRCEVKNEQEITYDLTIPRMLVLGPLALADKKRNVRDNFYLFLSYEIKGVEVNCLFKGLDNIYDIQSQVTRLKIETAQTEETTT